jgi:DNA-binding NtrC family response regulator
MNQSSSKHSVVVAVINSSEDTVDMLRTCLQQKGFTSVVTMHVDEIKRGQTDFIEFLTQHNPGVLVYDIAIPYEENWNFLNLLMSSEEMRGRRVVVTTTNKKVLESLVGETDAIEVHGKPYDLDQIAKSVEAAAESVGGGKSR